jgi:hypothetical protein
LSSYQGVLNLLPPALGVILLCSAASKFRHPKGFILTVVNYRVMPVGCAMVVGRILPYAELAVGGLLISGAYSKVATAAASALLLSFTLAVGINVLRGRDIDCGCFGSHSHPIRARLLLQDVSLTMLSLLVCERIPAWTETDPSSSMTARYLVGLIALCLVTIWALPSASSTFKFGSSVGNGSAAAPKRRPMFKRLFARKKFEEVF